FGGYSGDASYPGYFSNLVFDKKGNLYGTTSGGGAYNQGTVFEITAAGAGSVVYSFGSQPEDGNWPEGPLVFDKEGNLYGTTSQGGGSTNCNAVNSFGCGTVFKLAPDGTEKVLYA